jgi:hypothetical protein
MSVDPALVSFIAIIGIAVIAWLGILKAARPSIVWHCTRCGCRVKFWNTINHYRMCIKSE